MISLDTEINNNLIFICAFRKLDNYYKGNSKISELFTNLRIQDFDFYDLVL